MIALYLCDFVCLDAFKSAATLYEFGDGELKAPDRPCDSANVHQSRIWFKLWHLNINSSNRKASSMIQKRMQNVCLHGNTRNTETPEQCRFLIRPCAGTLGWFCNEATLVCICKVTVCCSPSSLGPVWTFQWGFIFTSLKDDGVAAFSKSFAPEPFPRSCFQWLSVLLTTVW